MSVPAGTPRWSALRWTTSPVTLACTPSVPLPPNDELDSCSTETEPQEPYAAELPGPVATAWPSTTRLLTDDVLICARRGPPPAWTDAFADTEPTVISPPKSERPPT